MKHTLKITLLLVSIFFITQVIGLAITNEYISTKEYVDPETKEVSKKVIAEKLPYNIERPKLRESTS